ncbi:hypothetical protein N864_22615 [Intrasporangium chromatireducens Q5-1]|uniref:Uncharacterized protein n=2 Tax=Intrasporangium TaxID=53357 RepID=W9GMH7_9MICO|nr:hypothetical protein N864_22615 [Intrasporangium chromatireducens Q5-1]
MGSHEADPKTFGGVESQSTADLTARARRHDYALRVVSERADGVLVVQFYTNLPAAERKVTRTRERGLRADLSLVRLTAVPFAVLDTLGGAL